MTIGHNGNDGRHIDAFIDEVMIFDYAVSAAAIADLSAYLRPGLVYYWPLDADARGYRGMEAGTIVGAVPFAGGRLEGGAAFDSEVNIPDVFSMPYTAIVWFRPRAPAARRC